MEREEQKSELECYIEGLFLNAAELEKAGVFFIIIGYTQFIRSADLEIIEIIKGEDTVLSKDEALITGQSYVFIGYLCLFFVAKKRLYSIKLENETNSEKIPTGPVEHLVFTYELSVLINIMRLNAFKQIRSIDINNKNRTEELD